MMKYMIGSMAGVVIGLLILFVGARLQLQIFKGAWNSPEAFSRKATGKRALSEEEKLKEYLAELKQKNAAQEATLKDIQASLQKAQQELNQFSSTSSPGKTPAAREQGKTNSQDKDPSRDPKEYARLQVDAFKGVFLYQLKGWEKPLGLTFPQTQSLQKLSGDFFGQFEKLTVKVMTSFYACIHDQNGEEKKGKEAESCYYEMEKDRQKERGDYPLLTQEGFYQQLSQILVPQQLDDLKKAVHNDAQGIAQSQVNQLTDSNALSELKLSQEQEKSIKSFLVEHLATEVERDANPVFPQEDEISFGGDGAYTKAFLDILHSDGLNRFLTSEQKKQLEGLLLNPGAFLRK